tara:strand:+ start:1571 stop:1915 length:345 start_codon:yes stop_codon:yes gene_type:complete
MSAELNQLIQKQLRETSNYPIEYKFNEDELLKELKIYIDKTYSMHYSKNQFQSTEFIIDSGHGTGFLIGNIMKYAQRYGRKGSPEEWRKDLMKIIHYSLLALYNHDNDGDLNDD